MKFAIKSNCQAHGRTRHNRSFKPLFFDIGRGILIDQEFEEEMRDEARKVSQE